MGIVHSPEVKMARRLIKKHSLEVPFDVRDLVQEYAEVLYKPIPIDGVDGICLHLKTAGKTPKVIVNTNASETRQNFTLAHELGHIIIPWHYGSIADEIQEEVVNFNSSYWQLEREANRFASELLMPFDWIFSRYKENPRPDHLLAEISYQCAVSDIAAKIRLENAIIEIEYLLVPITLILEIYNQTKDLAATQKKLVEITKFNPKRVAEIMVRDFPGRVAYCIESNNKVIGCGRSNGAHSFYQFEGSDFVKSPYKYFERYFVLKQGSFNTHWWSFDSTFTIPEDNRTWREILDAIANEISPGHEKKLKGMINGKLSGAHGSWKTKNKGSVEQFIEDTIYRFNNPDFKALLEHPDFLIFIKKRCKALYDNS